MESLGVKTKKHWSWTILIVVALLWVLFFVLQDSFYKKISETENISEASTAQSIENSGPEYAYFNLNPDKQLKVSALSYLVGDLATGEIILSHDEEKVFPIASVTKLMTALVAAEEPHKERTVQITRKILSTEGENGELRLNEQIKTSDLIYPLLLESSNDAAEAIAQGGERDAFMEDMNTKAKAIDLQSTTFEDPSGLSPNNTSTTLDLFKLAKHLNDYKPELFQISTQKSHRTEKHTWFSNNQFLRTEGYQGGKSGYTNLAYQTGISTFSLELGESEPRPLAITILKSKDRRKDVENILKYLKSNIFYGEKSVIAEKIAEKAKALEPPAPKEPDFVKLAFAGDIMLDRGVKSSVMKNFNGDYSALFEKLDILKNSDVVFANLEGTASDRGVDGGSLYSFRMDPSVLPALSGAGINIVSVANNHVGDWGRESFINTLSRLRENEILYTGGGMTSREAEQPATMEKNGIRLGFLAFSDKGPNWMKATEDSAGLLLASNPRFAEIIKSASEQVDYLVVSFHFGEEYQTTHDARQEQLAHRAIDNGAKIVIGHHPHVMQDTEVYRDGFIAYSLGNFIFDQKFSQNTMQGMLLEIKLSQNGEMTTTKNIVKLNSVFQPDTIVKGKEEQVKFVEPEIISQ